MNSQCHNFHFFSSTERHDLRDLASDATTGGRGKLRVGVQDDMRSPHPSSETIAGSKHITRLLIAEARILIAVSPGC